MISASFSRVRVWKGAGAFFALPPLATVAAGLPLFEAAVFLGAAFGRLSAFPCDVEVEETAEKDEAEAF